MTPDTILHCVQSFNSLIGTKYILHLGRARKHAIFEITIEKGDFHHLMGLHYLTDRPDRRNREKIFEDILSSEKYRKHLATSELWNNELESRVACTTILERILDDNATVIKYNPKRLTFYSMITAEYLFAHKEYVVTDAITSDVYLFIDKRDYTDDRFCKSIFTKKDRDFTEYQAKWTLLYKEKVDSDGNGIVLYHHNGYVLPE